MVRGENHLRRYVEALKSAGIRVSLFIEPDAEGHRGGRAARRRRWSSCTPAPIASARWRTTPPGWRASSTGSRRAATAAAAAGLEVHAGHGLTFNTVGGGRRASPEIVELNIGHFLVGRGDLRRARPRRLQRMRALMDEARAGRRAGAQAQPRAAP